ncbi:uncharacterized protein BX664DRAFT_111023 [Halteromyces radiatus]|uniref:uncharacterized protein n=1 Tax=Halteromyces radiatus TaxID=101107 RepID=UPI00221EB18C|nr:uncharacterized protein BX664DRAFT_111023 [Halteromyces radiatus]KAI8093610.1 hypothetical protein BX664DRAFT_111023 [Halteromyces radiatus]
MVAGPPNVQQTNQQANQVNTDNVILVDAGQSTKKKEAGVSTENRSHLLGHGLAKQLKDLFGSPNVNEMIPDRNIAGGAWKKFPFFLDGIKLVNVGEAMLSSRCNIPFDIFGGNWNDIIARKGRAMDWMDFLLFVVPTLILSHILDKKAQEVTHDMLLACHLCLRWEVRPCDLSFIRRSMSGFQKLLITATREKTISRRVWRITIHYLGHIAYIIERVGPMNVYSCRSMGRTIGAYKKKSVIGVHWS